MKEKPVEQFQVVSFLMRVKKNIKDNVPEQKELIKAYEEVLNDLRIFNY